MRFEESGAGSASKLFRNGADALLVLVVADHEKSVNHTRQPNAKREKEAEKKAPFSPGQKNGERRANKAKKEVHDD